MKTPWHLIDAYLDDSLTDNEKSELRHWLAADRQHVREFVLAVHQHSALRARARTLRAETLVPVGLENAERSAASAVDVDWSEVRTRSPQLGWQASEHRYGQVVFSVWRQMVRRHRRVWAGLAAGLVLLISVIFFNGANQGVLPEVLFDAAAQNAFVRPPETLTMRLARSLAGYRFAPFQSMARWLERRVPAYGPGSVVEVGSAGGAELRYTNEATVVSLKANTKLRILSARSGKRFELLSGVAEINAAPQPPGKPLKVITPMANVRVLGTRLALTASGRSTRVSVSEGEVQLESRTTRQHAKVATGQRAIAPTNASVTLQTLRPITNHYGTGSILREHWSNVRGRFVRDLTTNAAFQAPPNRLERVSSIEKSDTQTAGEDAYGARYRGYLHPPVSGEYTFWVAADDTGEVWLSTDERPENKRQICQASEWSRSFQNWWQYPDQESPSVHLEAGRRYYLEALHKEGGGGDFFSVAWQPPGAELDVISGADLSPFEPVKLARK